MPFTKAYAQQLSDLSAQIDTTLNNLYEESLTVFADDVGTKLNTSLQPLLVKQCGELSPDELKQLMGSNESEYGSRQRLFVLRQTWSALCRLNERIKRNEITTTEELAEEIKTINALLIKTTIPYAADLFKPHQVSERKTDFVKSLVGLAFRLLQKQLAIQQLLATNTSAVIPTYHESRTLQTARKKYNDAITAYNKKHTPKILSYTNAMRRIEAMIGQIKTLENETVPETATLKITAPETSMLETNLERESNDLAQHINTLINEDTTYEQLNELDTSIQMSAEALIETMRAYQTGVIDITQQKNTIIKDGIVVKKEALNELVNAAALATPEKTFNEPKTKTALAELRKLHDTLQQTINTEIDQLTTHQERLLSLQMQHSTNTQQAEIALPTYTPLLSETDDPALSLFTTACMAQNSTAQNAASPALKVIHIQTKWDKLAESLTTQFQAINNNYKKNNSLCHPGPESSVMDNSTQKNLKTAIDTTKKQIAALQKEKGTLAEDHKKRQERSAHLNHDMATVIDSTQKTATRCEEALDKLAEESETLMRSQYEKKQHARTILQQSNQKRRELTGSTEEKKTELEQAQIELEKTMIEIDFLKQRLHLLKQKLKANQLAFSDPMETPDTLLEKLETLSKTITLGLFLTKNPKDKNPDAPDNPLSQLDALTKKVDDLNDQLVRATQPHHYQHKGTLIGGLTGGGLSLLLLAGIVAVSFFSLPLTIPVAFLIGVGVVAAISPGISAAIGRFFGKHKDNTSLQKTQQQTTDKKNKARVKLNTEKSQTRLTRMESILKQEAYTATIDTADNSHDQETQSPPQSARRNRLANLGSYRSLRKSQASFFLARQHELEKQTPNDDPSDDETEKDTSSSNHEEDITLSIDPEEAHSTETSEASHNFGLFSRASSTPSTPTTSPTPSPSASPSKRQARLVTIESAKLSPSKQSQGKTSDTVLSRAHRPG